MLLPLDDNLASRLGRGRNINETIRVTIDDQGETLHYCGYKFLKVDIPVSQKMAIEMAEITTTSTPYTLNNQLLNKILKDF